jgi:hypothetical protein
MSAKNQKPELDTPQDDTDADAFAVLSLLIIIAATIVYYTNG